MAARWISATWVGFNDRTGEHIGILGDDYNEMVALKSRTVRRIPPAGRWVAKHIKGIVARPRRPDARDRTARTDAVHPPEAHIAAPTPEVAV